MCTAQNYDAQGAPATPIESTAQNSPPTVDSDPETPFPASCRHQPPVDEWHQQQVAQANRAVVVTVNSFFDLHYEELTPVRVMGNLLKHWLTTEYKNRIRQLTDEDLETSYLDNHLSAMLDTMGFLSQLEREQKMLELFERDLRSTQTGRA